MTREEWLEERKKGIGGSDAAVIVNKNPYPNRNTILLWEEKTRRRETPDISDNPYVKYGTEMEAILRESFRIKNPKYEVYHEEYSIIRHPKYPFLFASLDGTLVDKETGEIGVLEIKTSSMKNSSAQEKWKENIPDHYFCQVLHYLNVTGYSFAKVFAELNYGEDYQATRTYTITRANFEEDIKYLEKEEIRFWKEYVEKDIRPPLLIPEF